MNLTQETFYETMIQRYRTLSGFTPDEASDIALRFHALAGELAALGRRLESVRRDAFPETAQGAALDAFAAQRGLSRKAAVQAAGLLRFWRGASQAESVIPAGTVCLTEDGERYETTADAVLAEGEAAVDAPARAQTAGETGNALAGSIVRLAKPLAGIGGVSNPEPFTGGSGGENDESLRRRLLAGYAAPNNGANAAYYRERAEAFPGISSAYVTSDGEGGVRVYVAADGAAEVPEGTRAALQDALNAAREPCAPVAVLGAQATAVDLSIAVEPAAGLEPGAVLAPLAALLRAVVDALPIGIRLTRARLARLLLESGLVENFAITAPTADVACAHTQVLRAGEITISEMEG